MQAWLQGRLGKQLKLKAENLFDDGYHPTVITTISSVYEQKSQNFLLWYLMGQ